MMAISSSTISLPLVLLFGLVMLPQHCMASDLLVSETYMTSGSELVNGDYGLAMQEDCNLVLYNRGRPVWSSDTWKHGSNCRVYMHKDGNLVIYDGDWKFLWESGTRGRSGQVGGCILVLRRDGKLVIYGTFHYANGVFPPIGQHPKASPSAAAVHHLHHVGVNADNSTAQPANNRKISMGNVN